MLTKDQIIEGIAHLNQDDRDAVLDALIRRLNDVEADDDGRNLETVSDEEWTADIQRRLDQYDRGEVQGIPADKVFADLRQRLAEQRANRP